MLKNVHIYKSFYTLGDTLKKCYNCSYCRAFGNNINVNILPSEINPIFRKLPVAINLYYGDPLLQFDNTLKIIEKLEKDKHEGIVAIITKGDLRNFPKRNFDINLHIALSTFGIDSEYEGVRFQEDFRRNLDELYKLRMKNVSVSLEFRPIIYNINDQDEVIDRVLRLAYQYTLCVAFSGLQVPKNLRDRYNNKLPFEPYPNTKFGYKKYLSKEREDFIYTLAKSYKVPVFKKTSCLFSYLNNQRDYNAHYYRPQTNRCSECYNKKICYDYYNKLRNIDTSFLPFKHDIIYKEKHICGLMKKGECEFPDSECNNIKGYLIKPKDENIKMTTSDVRVIKWLTGLTVDCEFYESPYLSDFWYTI